MADFYLDFDGRQLVVRTDVPEVADFIARAYAPMLTARAFAPVGDLRVAATADGHRLHGASDLEVPGAAELLFPHIKSAVIYQFVTSRTDLLWLHAGAVEKDGVAVAIAGPSGRGKSTLVTLLSQAGWRLMADDVLALAMDADVVVPFPQAPNARVFPGRPVALDDVYALPRKRADLPPDRYCRTPARLGALVFPSYVPGGAADLVRQRPGDGALDVLKNCINVVDHKASAVSRVARLATAVPSYALTYSAAVDAAALLESLAGSLAIGCGAADDLRDR